MYDFSAALTHPDPRKREIAESLQHRAEEVLATARSIHAEPEISFREYASARKLVDVLSGAGFRVEAPIGGLDTAFRATAGSGSLVVSLCLEYDSLEGIGHACGHNLIAGASLGAGLALREAVDDLDITLQLIGTPAEEHGAGKKILLDNGVFEGTHLSLMTHPGPDVGTYDVLGSTSQAVGRFRTTFSGHAAHAAGFPHQGRNASDAAIIAQVAAGLLREQVEDGQRFALITRQAGVETNIIPDKAIVDWECRTKTLEDWTTLRNRIVRCLEAGAHAADCTLETVEIEPVYEPLLQNSTLGTAWNEAMAVLGRPLQGSLGVNAASTDMGNVSQRFPSLHPFVGVSGIHESLHSAAFAQAADTDAAYDLMFDSALAMAWIVEDIASHPQRRQQILSDAARLKECID